MTRQISFSVTAELDPGTDYQAVAADVLVRLDSALEGLPVAAVMVSPASVTLETAEPARGRSTPHAAEED